MDTSVYEAHRDKMMTGDAVIFSGTGLVSSIIKWRTKSPFTHVAMISRWKAYETERVLLSHATAEMGVHLVPVSRYLSRHKGSAWWVPLRKEGLPLDYDKQLRDVVLQDLGRQYDFHGIGQFLLPAWFQQQEGRRFCSKQSALWLTKIGLLQDTFVSPGSFIAQPIFKTPVSLI